MLDDWFGKRNICNNKALANRAKIFSHANKNLVYIIGVQSLHYIEGANKAYLCTTSLHYTQGAYLLPS